MFVYNLYI